MNAPSWRAGFGGARVLPAWLCGPGSCWRPPMVDPMSNSPTGWSWIATRSVSGATGSPRSGATDCSTNRDRVGPRVVGGEQIEALITATLESAPPDATHWSTRSMAEHLGLSQSMVSRVWRAFGLAPHKQDSWKLSKDPLFVEKVRDIVGLYLDPPERAMVLCVDEKTQIQALNRTAPVFPMLPGTPARATHDYVRHGTSSLYAALDLATGKVIGSLHSRHRSQEFLAFLKKIDAEVPPDLDCHVVLDNASTHKTPAVKRWLTTHPRFVLHFTPTSSSWLNLVERWFAEVTTKKLRRGTHTSVRQLNTDIRAWIENWNDNPRPYVWTKTADQILESVANYCKRINNSGH